MVEIADELLRERISSIDGKLGKFRRWPEGTKQFLGMLRFPDGEELPRREINNRSIALQAQRDLLNEILEGRFQDSGRARMTEGQK